jgi:hypothetical protein
MTFHGAPARAGSPLNQEQNWYRHPISRQARYTDLRGSLDDVRSNGRDTANTPNLSILEFTSFAVSIKSAIDLV